MIADDHSIVRRAVRAILEVRPHFEVCAEVENGAQAIEAVERLKPDIIVLDVHMPVMDGFSEAKLMKTNAPQSAIVILSSETSKHFVEAARRIGARAYVTKSKAATALLEAIEAVMAGGGDFVVVT